MTFIKVPTPSGEPYFVNADKIQKIVTHHEVRRTHNKEMCFLIMDNGDEIHIEMPIAEVADLMNEVSGYSANALKELNHK